MKATNCRLPNRADCHAIYEFWKIYEVACFQYVLSFVLQLLGLPTLCFQYLLSFVEFFIGRTFCRSVIRTSCHADFVPRTAFVTGVRIPSTAYHYSLNSWFCQGKKEDPYPTMTTFCARGWLAVPFYGYRGRRVNPLDFPN